MELTKEEERALKGEHGEVFETAYRILVATGEAMDADRLIPIKWAHLSGVNYNTIGDSGEQFLSDFTKNAKVHVKTSLNPMGYDIDHIDKSNLDENFVVKQESIRRSYKKLGVLPTFSCIPYEIFNLPEKGTQIAFAESNAAIYANSIAGLKTNKESAFSALASAITGKSPYTSLRKNDHPNVTIRMKIPDANELTFGMLGFFAGKTVSDQSVNISGITNIDKRRCKSLCGGMGTSGTCAKFVFTDNSDPNTEKIDFEQKESQDVFDELNTADSGDVITLGSPQLGLDEISDLSLMLKGKKFNKRCMVFCPRVVQEQAREIGYTNNIEGSGCEILSDCCTCLTPLINKNEVDSVTTNSIKGAYYLKNSNKVGVNLKPLSKIIEDETS